MAFRPRRATERLEPVTAPEPAASPEVAAAYRSSTKTITRYAEGTATTRQVRAVGDAAVDALVKAAATLPPVAPGTQRPLNLEAFRAQAAKTLAPAIGSTPADIEAAMEAQGQNWAQIFGPGKPIDPMFGYSRPPRQWDYVTGRNVQQLPRADRLPFATLKGIIDNYDVAQICIRHILSDLLSMGLQWMPADGIQEDCAEDIAKAKAFWRFPDGRRRFRHWLSSYLQDVLRYDAGTLYKRRSIDGKLLAPWSPGIKVGPDGRCQTPGGWGLTVVQGTTISPLVDYYGGVPLPPAPAYVQFINGVSWDWLEADDLVYEPFTPFPESPYGLAPVESVLLNANTDIRFQWHFLNYFTDGTVPDGFMEAPPDASSPAQVEEWQAFFDAIMEGDQSKKHQIRFVPAGSRYTPAKDAAFAEAFPEYLLRRTIAAFGLVPNDLGFTENVNKSVGETQVDVQFRISTLPRTGFLEDIFDEINGQLGLRVKMRFDTGQEKEDRLAEAQAWDIWIKNGSASSDEARQEVLGLPVNPEEMVPRIFFSTRAGAIPLKSIMEIAGDIDLETGAPKPGSVTPADDVLPGQPVTASGTTPTGDDLRSQRSKGVSGSPPPSGAPVASDAQEAAATGAGNSGDQMSKAETGGLTAATGVSGDGLAGGAKAKMAKDDDDDDNEVSTVLKALRDWQGQATRRVRRGEPPRCFEGIPDYLVAAVWPALEPARSVEDVEAAFGFLKAEEDPLPKAEGVEAGPDTPAHDLGLKVAARYRPILGNVLAKMHPGAISALRKAVDQGGSPEHIAAIWSQLVGSTSATEAATDVLRDLWTDSYLASMSARLAGNGATGAGVTTTLEGLAVDMDWDHWTPGHTAAARAVADDGLRKLLDQAGVTIQGISDTQMARLTKVISTGLGRGDGVPTVGRALRAIVGDPQRAQLIAHTEMARGMEAAQQAFYTASGISWWDWIPGTCPVCTGLAEAGPYQVGGSQDPPPAHPGCTCASAPSSGP